MRLEMSLRASAVRFVPLVAETSQSNKATVFCGLQDARASASVCPHRYAHTHLMDAHLTARPVGGSGDYIQLRNLVVCSRPAAQGVPLDPGGGQTADVGMMCWSSCTVQL
jgi:hypothetical protein